MLLFLAPLSLIHFWPASTREPCSCILSRPETDPQILERWGYADEVHLGKCIRAKEFGLEFQCDAQIAFVNLTRWIGFGMFVLFRRIDFGGW